ncbi:hypothetical protein GOBAR_AA25280 [Gossypium barbadense]|uniref:Uncharacterized protein n=1 Tax=Gossypium barbadense TaxID=3634 RepID=A0A2P5WWB0_GOSBA|nr:hypothetical protein GOBAR_AA25280 [Gossypium barbadense]
MACRYLRDGGRTDALDSSLWSEDGTLSIVPSLARAMLARRSQRIASKDQWPEVFGKVLPGAYGGTAREGDEFLRLDPWKMALPSVSWKQSQMCLYTPDRILGTNVPGIIHT